MAKLDKTFLEGNEPKPEKRINVYTCPKGHKMITKEIDEGTTPMRKACMIVEHGRTCGQIAISAWYNCDQDQTPEYEWYRPTGGQKLSKEERDYCKQGGLLIRKIGEVTATPKDPDDGTIVGRNEPCPCGKMTTGPNPRPVKFKHCHINDRAGLAAILLEKKNAQ